MLTEIFGTFLIIIAIYIIIQLGNKSPHSSIRKRAQFLILNVIGWTVFVIFFRHYLNINPKLSLVFLYISSNFILSAIYLFSKIISEMFSDSIHEWITRAFMIIYFTVFFHIISYIYLFDLFPMKTLYTVININQILLTSALLIGLTPFIDISEKNISFVDEDAKIEYKYFSNIKYMFIPLFITSLINIIYRSEIILVFFSNIIVFLLYLVYVLNRIKTLRLFQARNTFQLFIINKNGNLIFQKNYSLIKSQVNVSIFSNWLIAFSTILTQYLDSEIKPKSINLEGQIIHLNWSEEFLIAVISDNISPVVIESVEKTKDGLHDKLILKHIVSGYIPHDITTKMEDLVSKSFYYYY